MGVFICGQEFLCIQIGLDAFHFVNFWQLFKLHICFDLMQKIVLSSSINVCLEIQCKYV